MRQIVYAVIVTYVDDIMVENLDNIYPTAESAIVRARILGMCPACYEVHVDKDEVTEEFGRGWLSTIYKEKHEERYL